MTRDQKPSLLRLTWHVAILAVALLIVAGLALLSATQRGWPAWWEFVLLVPAALLAAVIMRYIGRILAASFESVREEAKN